MQQKHGTGTQEQVEVARLKSSVFSQISREFVTALLVFLVVASVIVPILRPIIVGAQENDNEVEPGDTITVDDINSILGNTENYDPNTEECEPSGGSTTAASGNAYVLGDSISYGLQLDGLETKLSQKLGGTATINYDSGRSITGAGTQVKTSALEAVETDKATINSANVIIIVLGTNMTDDPFLEKMNELLTVLKGDGYAPNAKYYWVDIGANRSDSAAAWSERNRIIYDNAAAGGYSVISRYKALFGQDKDPLNINSSLPFPGSDNVHGGYTELSEEILNTITASSQSNTSQAGNCVCSTGGSTTLTGSNVAEQFWNYLVNDLGFTAIQAAGIMGNVEQESRFNPTIVNPQSGAYGLIQWYAGRLTGLENYAAEQGKDKSDVVIQLEYMKIELEGAYRETVYEPIKATDDMAEALRIWLERFEVPCIPGSAACDTEVATRTPFAQNYLALYGSNTGGGSSGSSSVGCATNSSGVVVGDYSLPVDQSWYEQQPGWFTKPHHDYPAADIPVPEGTPIYSMTSGTVISAPAGGACGNGVIVQSPEGYVFTYCHGSDGGAVEGAKNGDTVKAGQLIMHSSWTGNVIPPNIQGTHLHLGIKVNNSNVCPQTLFTGIMDGLIPDIASLPTSGCTN